jgi:hypothetical protein
MCWIDGVGDCKCWRWVRANDDSHCWGEFGFIGGLCAVWWELFCSSGGPPLRDEICGRCLHVG